MWRATADKDQARIIRRRLCNSETQHNQVLRSPIAIMLPSEQNLLLFNMCHRLNKDCKARFIRMVEQYGEQQWQAIKPYRMYDLRREYVNQLFRVQWEDRKRGSCNADQYIDNLPDEAFSSISISGRSASVAERSRPCRSRARSKDTESSLDNDSDIESVREGSNSSRPSSSD